MDTNTTQVQPQKSYKSLILEAGAVIGIICTLVGTFLPYLLNGNKVVNILAGVGTFIVLIIGLIIYGKRAAQIKDVDGAGFSYGQAFSFSILVLIIAGAIVAICNLILQTVIDPQYFQLQVDLQMKELIDKGIPSEQIRMAKKMVGVMTNPIVLFFINIFGTIMNGCFVALFTSAIVKRRPQF